MAANKGHQSITFPALGTGTLRYPVKEVATAMIEAITEFVEDYPDATVREVEIVVYHLDKITLQVRTNIFPCISIIHVH